MLGTKFDPTCYQILDSGLAAAGRQLFDKAGMCFREAIDKRPSLFAAHVNLGAVLWTQKKPEQAAESFRNALAINPRSQEALVGLGVIYAETDRLEEAVDCLRQAMVLQPSGMGYMNLGNVYRRLGKRKQAMHSFEAAVALENDPFYQLNRGFEYLLFGRFEEGWRDFAARMKLAYGHTLLDIYKDKRVWDGVSHVDHLVVHFEQGLGDAIQAARYLDATCEHCDRLTFVPHVGLGSLMAHSFAHNPKINVSETVPDAYDAYMWSDTMITRAGIDPIPNQPYLSVPETKRWRHLQSLPGLKVGLIWAGRTEQVVDRRRTMPFEFTHKLFEIPGVRFVSLQKDRKDVHAKLYDASPYLNDWKATAGAMNALDLILSVDTSTAHLAGALGKPVWLMNRFDTCWRWQLDRTDSPWYPSMRIFRQPAPNDWASLIDEVYVALERLVREDW